MVLGETAQGEFPWSTPVPAFQGLVAPAGKDWGDRDMGHFPKALPGVGGGACIDLAPNPPHLFD